MQLETLDQWLQWQMELHGQAIDLGLDRVREVATRMELGPVGDFVIIVAGTNGKGSTVAAYETWLRHAGFEVASYTSPHLLRYNERVKRNCETVSDEELCSAFAAVESARGDTSLTYFEYGTLAALYLFSQWQPDYTLLEVGLGGRLDAVNIIDADLVHLTPIGIDHQAWLGDDREQIGLEKAGVLRAGVKVVLNDPDPPRSVLQQIEQLGCSCLRLGHDYRLQDDSTDEFLWQGNDRQLRLAAPLAGRHQRSNLAGVLAGLSLALGLERFDDAELRGNFEGMRLAGRFQQVESPLAARLFVDVGHNPDAASALAENIETLRGDGRVVVLLGMLVDKQPGEFVEILDPVVDEWWLLSLQGERGQSATELERRISDRAAVRQSFDDIHAALEHALSSLQDQDIMLVTGSFVSVELLLRALPDSGELNQYGSKH